MYRQILVIPTSSAFLDHEKNFEVNNKLTMTRKYLNHLSLLPVEKEKS